MNTTPMINSSDYVTRVVLLVMMFLPPGNHGLMYSARPRRKSLGSYELAITVVPVAS